MYLSIICHLDAQSPFPRKIAEQASIIESKISATSLGKKKKKSGLGPSQFQAADVNEEC